MSAPTVQLQASDYNLEHLTTKQLEAHIDASIALCSNLLVVGRRGLGKTQITRTRTAAAGKFLCELNASMFERCDLSGYPRLSDPTDEFIRYVLPMKFKELITGTQRCVLFLDEVDKAEKELFAALLEIVQERAINARLLPNLDCIIMTGNLPGEGGQRPIPPLLDRTEAYLVEASSDEWLEWAGRPEARIHPSVFKFINDHPSKLCGAVDHPHYYKSESPRAWHKVSNMAHFAEANHWSNEMIEQKVAGFVGKSVGMDFKLYFTTYQSILPIVDAIFDNKPYHDDFTALAPSERLYVGIIASSRLTSILDANVDVLKVRETAPINEETRRPRFMSVDECIREDSPKNSLVRKTLHSVGGFYKALFDEHPEFVMTCVHNQIGEGRMVKWDLGGRDDWHGVLGKTTNMISPITESFKLHSQAA